MSDPIQLVYDMLDRSNRDSVATYRFKGARFNPSKISSCPRAQWYRNMGEVPRVVPGRISLFGKDGDIAHDVARWMMRNAGVQLRGLDFNEVTGTVDETNFFKRTVEHNGEQLVLSGRGDGEIFHPDYGEWMDLEIKSLDGMKYRYMQKAFDEGNIFTYLWKDKKEKYFKYLEQMLFTNKGSRSKNRYGYLLFKDRSLCELGFHNKVTGKYEGLVIDFHEWEDHWTVMLDRMALVQKHTREKEPVPFDLCPMEGSYECDVICDYRHICANGKKDG